MTVKTLDGTETFHGMGIISMTTPCTRLEDMRFSDSAVKRLPHTAVSQMIRNRGIPIIYYVAPDQPSLSKFMLKPFSHLLTPYVMPPTINLDLVWHAGWFYTDADNPRSSWAGFMHDVSPSSSDFPSKSDIRNLSIIDMNPNDVSCIFSTLTFIGRQSKKLNLETACVTFDQVYGLRLWK